MYVKIPPSMMPTPPTLPIIKSVSRSQLGLNKSLFRVTGQDENSIGKKDIFSYKNEWFPCYFAYFLYLAVLRVFITISTTLSRIWPQLKCLGSNFSSDITRTEREFLQRNFYFQKREKKKSCRRVPLKKIIF